MSLSFLCCKSNALVNVFFGGLGGIHSPCVRCHIYWLASYSFYFNIGVVAHSPTKFKKSPKKQKISNVMYILSPKTGNCQSSGALENLFGVTCGGDFKGDL